MRPDRPEAVDLIETAAIVLRAELLDAAPEEHRLTLRMALAALQIGLRDLRETDALLQAEAEALSALYPDAAVGHVELAKRLAAEIRAGRFDEGGEAARLHHLLLDDVRRRLAISNPSYLAQAEDSGAS